MAKLQIGSFQSFKICGAGCVEPERLPMSIQAPPNLLLFIERNFFLQKKFLDVSSTDHPTYISED